MIQSILKCYSDYSGPSTQPKLQPFGVVTHATYATWNVGSTVHRHPNIKKTGSGDPGDIDIVASKLRQEMDVELQLLVQVKYNVGVLQEGTSIWEWFIAPVYGALGDGLLL